ncbi:E3 ubiquitin-protein ligase RING1-like [Phragmites australis]|uniref:E3 ubiquitin-protein ligase RING1-like n=1 Tax=Phragmites australis TaxID=29695 RepID=UPI002D7992B7|nr:E3 ubiquitin-protein ligase RING1-like [Phragmites australis]
MAPDTPKPKITQPPHQDPPDPPDCQDSERGCSPPVLPPPSSSPAPHGRSTFVTALIIAGSVLAFLAVCLSIFLFVRRRRQRRLEALLEATLPPAPAAAFPDGDGGGGPDPEEDAVHHAWHIRTVGLDEAAIESIALTRYRAGAGGVLGASDCAVCLGEFRDGELLRLLPKCTHAFHVPCIDTWLRAHVNCPLCRARVLDPATAEQPDPPAEADADAERDIGALEHEQPGQHADDQQELRVHIEQRDQPSSSPEQRHRQPGPRGRNFRRFASMDSPWPIEAPEDEQRGGDEKQGTGGAVYCELSPGSGHLKNHRGMKRSLSVGSRWALASQHCRRSYSLLPL